ncbi:hypothetical protein NLU14_20755 [Marinobacter sp. 71-i]|uniref:Uncharacterized protein n=1 Tax=Marinobacter iranensis TaxID=2962607 RepID=A0ABT5YG77_9GAMM|nr:hypothetical protein [Marinobacter iranensis]MDF0752663.1 hypothetical protein [Marinobacter iranensis]
MTKKFTPLDFKKHPKCIQLDGNNLFAVKYETKHSKLFIGYSSIEVVLSRCIKSANYLKKYRKKIVDDETQENISAHFISGVVNYGRCFTSGRIKLEKTLIPNKYLKTHERIIKMRHKYIAHYDGFGETSLCLVALYPNGDTPSILHIEEPRHVRINFINEDLWEDVKNICEILISHVKEKQKLHYEKLCEEIRSTPLSQLYEGFDDRTLFYNPKFTPGQYSFRLNIEPSGFFELKGNLIKK